MTTETVHEFAADDPRARLTWHGQTYRAVRVERSDEHGLSVWVVRTTKAGADFKRPNSYMWLTLTNSLDPFGDDSAKALAAYVREIAEPAPAEPAKGRCPWCGQMRRLTTAGRLSTHPGDFHGICAGSGQRPAATSAATEPGPIDKAAVTARRIDSLLNSGAAEPEPAARSVCRYCGLVVETGGDPDAADAEWTSAAGPGLTGRRRECAKAPNPTDGPMPGHRPGVIARRPR